MSDDTNMTSAASTTQVHAPSAGCSVARWVFPCRKTSWQGGKTVPPLHPLRFLARHAPFLKTIRFFPCPQSYLEV